MAPPVDHRRRAELLDDLIQAFADGGIGGRSLRDIAETVGTSHRMLIHHFGTRDAMLLAIVDEVERRQAARIRDLPASLDRSFAITWEDIRRPEMWPFERLFFECYARGAQGEEPFRAMLPGAVDGWLAEVADATGGRADPALTRLFLGVARGLLLDLVATGDREGVDAAAACFEELLRRLPRTAGAPKN